MSLRQWTIVFIITATLGLIGWDIYAFLKGGSMVTISLVILGWSKDYPILPFAFGVLCGHLFVPIGIEKGDKK